MPHMCAAVDSKNRYRKGENKKFYHFSANMDRKWIWVMVDNIGEGLERQYKSCIWMHSMTLMLHAQADLEGVQVGTGTQEHQ